MYRRYAVRGSRIHKSLGIGNLSFKHDDLTYVHPFIDSPIPRSTTWTTTASLTWAEIEGRSTHFTRADILVPARENVYTAQTPGHKVILTKGRQSWAGARFIVYINLRFWANVG
jgi:hypothetical protein